MARDSVSFDTTEEDLKQAIKDLEHVTKKVIEPSYIALREFVQAFLHWAITTGNAAPHTGYEHQSQVLVQCGCVVVVVLWLWLCCGCVWLLLWSGMSGVVEA